MSFSMNSVNTEHWYAWAVGLPQSWLTEILAVKGHDTRRTLERERAWPGWIMVESTVALGYSISHEARALLMQEVPDRVYKPAVRDQGLAGKPDLVVNASVDKGMLSCTMPEANYVTCVFEWNVDDREFTLVGPLVENNQLPAGWYVLSNSMIPKAGKECIYGLPSLFLEIV